MNLTYNRILVLIAFSAIAVSYLAYGVGALVLCSIATLTAAEAGLSVFRR